MFAIFETGGKQYKVKVGDVIYVEKIDTPEGQEVTFNKVLMIDNFMGKPYLEKSSVTCKVEKHGKQKKINIIKHKRYSRYLKRQGHRQPYTRLSIVSINHK